VKRALQRSDQAAAAMHEVFAKELGAISNEARIPFEAIMGTFAAGTIVNDHLVEAEGIEAKRMAATAVHLAGTLLDAAERLPYRIDLSAQGLFNLLFSLPGTFGEASDTSCVPKGVREVVAERLFPKVGNRIGGRAAHVYGEVRFAPLNEALVIPARDMPGEWYRCQVLASLAAVIGWTVFAADSRLCRQPHADRLMQRLVLMSLVEGERTNHWRAEVLAHVTTMLGAAGCAQWMRNEGSVLLDAAQYDRQVRRLAVGTRATGVDVSTCRCEKARAHGLRRSRCTRLLLPAAASRARAVPRNHRRLGAECAQSDAGYTRFAALVPFHRTHAGSCLCWLRAPPDSCPRRSLRSGTAFSRAAAFSTNLLSQANLLHVPQCSPSSSSIHFGIPRPRHRFSTAVARDVHFAVPLTLQSSRAHHVVQVPDSDAHTPAHLGTRTHSHSHNHTCACTCVRLCVSTCVRPCVRGCGRECGRDCGCEWRCVCARTRVCVRVSMCVCACVRAPVSA